MKLTKEQVEHIANLAKLKLTPEEVERFASQMTDILSYVEILGELDTKGVPETSQVTGLLNVSREDEARGVLATPDELLECSPLPKVDHQIRIKRIM